MKRLIPMLLLVVFCLSMAACSSVDKDFEAADALLQAGDYEGAIAAFSAIGRYEEISAKIQEAEKLRDEANTGFLYGVWKDILYEYGGEADLVIMEDGKALFAEMAATYSYENGVLTITSPMIVEFKCEEIDGVMHLRGSLDYEMDYVPEANYEKLGPYTVELTKDNWDEYFELRPTANMSINQFDEIEYASNSYGVFLKDEYLDKINQNSFHPNGIDFQISYDVECFLTPVSSNEEAHKTVFDLSQLEKIDPPYFVSDWQTTGETDNATVYDARNRSDASEKDPYYNTVAARFYSCDCSVVEYNGDFYLFAPVNAEVNRVQGSLVLFR